MKGAAVEDCYLCRASTSEGLFLSILWWVWNHYRSQGQYLERRAGHGVGKSKDASPPASVSYCLLLTHFHIVMAAVLLLPSKFQANISFDRTQPKIIQFLEDVVLVLPSFLSKATATMEVYNDDLLWHNKEFPYMVVRRP